MAKRVVSFFPGPAHVRDEVLAAMSRPPNPHRSADFRDIVSNVQQRLGEILHTDAPVIPVLGSGTTSNEIALQAIARRRVLSLCGGAFAERLAKIAAGLGFDVERLTVPPGWPITPDLVERALAAGEFDAVTVVHSETSTGALSDVASIARVVHRHPGTALLVDAVSSLGAVDLDFDALGPRTILVSVTGKALACPPGMSLMAVGREAAERARGAEAGGFALRLASLLEHHAKSNTPNTPNSPLFYALDVQLARILAEGTTARAERHAEMARRVQAWAEAHFAVLALEGARSPSVTAIENTRAIDVPLFLAAVLRRGFRIANGYGELKNASFRVGHMGDVTVAETDALLRAMHEALAEIG